MSTFLPQQLFGTLERADHTILNTMLCIDSDLPDEAMLHWWLPNDLSASGGALVKLSQIDSDSIEISPVKLYYPTESFNLYLPNLTQSEIERFQGYSGKIYKTENAFEGEYEHNSCIQGTFQFGLDTSTENIEPYICSDWNEFKKWANGMRDAKSVAIFRGHGSNTFPLKTTLHRVGRHRLERYCSETLLEFKNHAEATLDRRFNLSDGEEYSILLGLAQHYGLPTPLLDWTCSPYIAAFFAFTDALESFETRQTTTHVRIFGLTNNFLNSFTPPIVQVPYISPYFAHLDIPKRNNPRLYAQQGSFLVTNVADLEHFICKVQANSRVNLLVAVDIPIEFAHEALADLKFMGLTAATMFPGLDGVCKMLKQSMSYVR